MAERPKVDRGTLDELLERARGHVMTDEEREAQRQLVWEKVLSIEHWGSGVAGSAPENLQKFIAWAEAALAKVPPEYRHSASISIDSVGEYDGEHHVEIEIAYQRPENAIEAADRAAKSKRARLQREMHERKIYEDLRKKYGEQP